jgi:hypothetical protein
MITENRKTFNREKETSPTIRHKNPVNWHVLLLVDPFEKIHNSSLGEKINPQYFEGSIYTIVYI